jgi:hypothetical protein
MFITSQLFLLVSFYSVYISLNNFRSSRTFYSRRKPEANIAPVEAQQQNGILGPDPARTRCTTISHEVCRSTLRHVVHIAARATPTSTHCSILQQLPQLSFRFAQLNLMRLCANEFNAHHVNLRFSTPSGWTKFKYVAFEVLTAVDIKSSIFWVRTPVQSGRFGPTNRLNLQGRRVSHARRHHEAGGRPSKPVWNS